MEEGRKEGKGKEGYLGLNVKEEVRGERGVAPHACRLSRDQQMFLLARRIEARHGHLKRRKRVRVGGGGGMMKKR